MGTILKEKWKFFDATSYWQVFAVSGGNYPKGGARGRNYRVKLVVDCEEGPGRYGGGVQLMQRLCYFYLLDH